MEKNQTNQYGNPNGYWEYYYDNGKLAFKGNYVNGNRHGYFESYWSNGQLFYKGNYVNGKEYGYFEEYFSNGDLYYKGNYENGKKVNYGSNFPPLLIRLKRKLKSLFTNKKQN
jgi:antitoxin component YwqK of YwqJK toxin-antitoxin module